MPATLPNKILIIGTIRKDESILLRKKFANSEPYKETWYSFGCEFVSGEDPADTFSKYINDSLGIAILSKKHLSWDTEIKTDHDGLAKQFVYLELEANYVSGEMQIPDGLEKVEFVAIDDLPDLDIVPPSVKMFRRIGYLE